MCRVAQGQELLSNVASILPVNIPNNFSARTNDNVQLNLESTDAH